MHVGKLQSAMEYLMTYGWAILIIAVVLGVLYYLGIFNPYYFAPRAQPGSCQVLRPYGSGTATDINLAGVCADSIPKFVMHMNIGSGMGGVYNIPTYGFPTGSEPFTITAWFKTTSQGLDFYIFSYGSDPISNPNGNNQLDFKMDDGQDPVIKTAGPNGNNVFDAGTDYPINDGKWHFVAVTYYALGSTSHIEFYVDNTNTVSINSPVVLDTAITGQYTGAIGTLSDPSWNGELADVQFYNASLGPNSINAIYSGGIGGDPIDLQHLVGWWPLNGNTKDYSGNGNSGASSNSFFTGGYALPSQYA